MKIFKGIIAFLLFVFCLGFLAGLSNKNNIDWGSLFPGKETEVITDEVNETSASQDTEALTSDLQEFTSEPQESMTEVSPDEVDFSKLSMNCLGDSVTNKTSISNSYVPALQTILNLKNCRNYGVSGSTISIIREETSFVNRYPFMDDAADIISVFGGINDECLNVEIGVIDDTDTHTFYGALNTLIVGLQEKYPEAYIFLIAPYKLYRSDYGIIDETVVWPPSGNGKYTCYDYNVAIRAIGEKYDIDVLNLWELDIDESCFVDGTHPADDFINNVLAPTIAQFIKDNYKKPN